MKVYLFTRLCYLASNGAVIVNHAFERMWKEVVVAYLKVVPQHFHGMTKENNENISQTFRI
jgi:hypothetical protein